MRRMLFWALCLILLGSVLSFWDNRPVDAAGVIKVQFFNSIRDAISNTLAINFKLVNIGSSSVVLSNVKIRYYFTIDAVQTLNYFVDWASVGNTNVTGTFVTMSAPNADRYLELGFTSAAGSIEPGKEVYVYARISKQDWSNFDQSNDYSFNASASSLVDWERVTAYISGALEWGIEPGGIVPTPSIIATPTLTPTQSSIITPTPTPSVISTPTATPTPTMFAATYPAENAVYGGGAIFEDINGGYNGSGYVNFPASGGYLEFQNVNGGAGGSVILRFRYALGVSSSRTGTLRVNNLGTSITFEPTGSWTTWNYKEVGVNLNSGTGNTIRLESTGQDLANIDELSLGSSVPPTIVPTPTATPTSTPTPSPTPSVVPTPTIIPGARQMENLDRGVVAVKVSNGVFVSWRILGTEWSGNVSYNLYRGSTRVNSSPITGASNYVDTAGTTGSTYTVRAVVNGVEQAASSPVGVWSQNYLSVPIQRPSSIYSANDCSVGDLDGDHQYEIVVKWEPSDAKDNSQSGFTSNVYLDAYKLNGTRLWRIDLGRNIRAGAHYTQFMVYDLDGDGRAEVACKTAPGTRSGTGSYLSTGPAANDDDSADYRNSSGYILTGPEYLTIFNGRTGAEIVTVNYEPGRGSVSSWGDNYGNRVDRFLACVAYLDGQRPSLVMCRGYYTRTVLVAWDFRNGRLTRRWTFDTNNGYSSYQGQGNHNLSVADVDADGKDEIVYGACCIDDNGAGLWNSGLGHGDAMHVFDIDPNRPGLEVWGIHEGSNTPGSALLDARTGAVIWKTANADVGRGVAADLTSSPGGECWGGTSDLRTCTNGSAGSTPSSANHLIWWDGDEYRELLDGTSITKYGGGTLLSASGCASNNGSKSNPCLTADILGDWREEAIWRTSDSSALRIYTTTYTTNRRLFTLMHDSQYRVSIAWQNVAYNQPPHTGFRLGNGMPNPPAPSIYLAP